MESLILDKNQNSIIDFLQEYNGEGTGTAKYNALVEKLTNDFDFFSSIVNDKLINDSTLEVIVFTIKQLGLKATYCSNLNQFDGSGLSYIVKKLKCN